MTSWPTVRLAEVAVINPTRPRDMRSLDDAYEVTFVPMPAVNQYTGEIDAAQVKGFGEVKKGFTYFSEGDVIFAKITPCMQNGKSAIARGLKNGLGFGSTEFHVIRPNSEKLLPEWIWHFVRQAWFRDEGVRHFRGAVGQQRVPEDYLGNAEIPLPPLHEQRRIVARIKECMERVEEIEGLRAQTIDEAMAVLPSVLNEVFTSQAASAPVKTIGAVSTETRYGTSQKCHTEPTGMPILRIPNVARGAVNFDDLKFCVLGEGDAVRMSLRRGDLLFVRTNGSRDLVGRCAIFDGDVDDRQFGFASYLIRVRVDQAVVLPRYLAYFLNSTSGRAELDSRRRTSAGQFNINSENLRSIEFPVPAINEQRRLLSILEEREAQARSLVSELQAAHSEGNGVRDAILRKALAGEL